MSPLRKILKYRNARQLGCTVHSKNVRSVSSTGKSKDAPISTLKADVDGPKSEDDDFDPYRHIRTQEKPRLLRPIIFTLGVGLCTFAGAAYLTQREAQQLAQAAKNPDASVGDLRRGRIMLELKQANTTFSWLKDRGCPEFITGSFAWLGTRWLNYSDGERVGIGLLAVNAVVFLAWQIPLPTVHFFMVKHFMHHPLSGRSHTLLTSVFSHRNLLHFGVNMVAMQSFVREASWYIGSAQSLDPDFRGITDSDRYTPTEPNSTYSILAFFLTAGVFSMFGSHASAAVGLMRARRRTLDLAALAKARRAIKPSLGASGAVYATVIITALAMPDMAVQFLFLPFLAAPIRWGATGLIAMDSVGILRGWQVMDHYGHLSGAAFGGAYFFVGPYLWAGTAKFMSSKTLLSRD